MTRIAIVAAFAIASSGAIAANCKPTDDSVAAQTAKCLLSVDDNVFNNKRCNVMVSPDGREFDIDTGKYFARVSVTLDQRGSSHVLTAYWNRGSGRSDNSTSLGRVSDTNFDRGSAMCWRNRRVEMCMSEFITCDCKPGEYYHCSPVE
jgi:hypothetical protein